jgi:hypothetical protein
MWHRVFHSKERTHLEVRNDEHYDASIVPLHRQDRPQITRIDQLPFIDAFLNPKTLCVVGISFDMRSIQPLRLQQLTVGENAIIKHLRYLRGYSSLATLHLDTIQLSPGTTLRIDHPLHRCILTSCTGLTTVELNTVHALDIEKCVQLRRVQCTHPCERVFVRFMPTRWGTSPEEYVARQDECHYVGVTSFENTHILHIEYMAWMPHGLTAAQQISLQSVRPVDDALLAQLRCRSLYMTACWTSSQRVIFNSNVLKTVNLTRWRGPTLIQFQSPLERIDLDGLSDLRCFVVTGPRHMPLDRIGVKSCFQLEDFTIRRSSVDTVWLESLCLTSLFALSSLKLSFVYLKYMSHVTRLPFKTKTMSVHECHGIPYKEIKNAENQRTLDV